MSLIVQKYGGTSVTDVERIKNVARRIAKFRDRGDQLVVVVSAMGDATDDLIELAKQVTSRPDNRELDLLLSTGEIVSATLLTMALQEMGYPAVSLTGAQAGIRTDSDFTRARILEIEVDRLRKELDQGKTVIVAGFQGITNEEEITTLGRGGSDTTAVALAAALGAKVCERYTDTEGIFSADPRIVPDAVRLDEISYDEMLELATYGTRVMHPRAIELGELYNIPILVASSFTDSPGTLIHGGVCMEVRNKVRNVAYDLDVAKVSVMGVPDRPGIAAALFEALAKAGVSVDTIVQNAGIGRLADLTFTVTRGQLAKALEVIQPIVAQMGAKDIVSDARLGKVSIIGTGMSNTPGFAARMFRTLSEKGVNIQLITTSEIRITCIIDEAQVKEAVRALHKAFEVEIKE